jgi:hypothetical protein
MHADKLDARLGELPRSRDSEMNARVRISGYGPDAVLMAG